MLKTLRHIVRTQRFCLSRFLNRPFDKEKESQPPETFDQLVQLYRATHEELLAFVTNLTESDLERRFDLPFLKSQPTIAEGLTQVVTATKQPLNNLQTAQSMRQIQAKSQ